MEFLKKTLNKVNFKYLFLMAFFLIFSGLIYRLLYLEQIAGTEFVALIIAILFSCLIINFLNEIQELSIGGNLLKLKEAKSEVNDAIEQLKSFRLEAFRLFLSSAAELPGGWGTIGFNDDRAKRFVDLIEQIHLVGLFDELKGEINTNALIITKGHLRKLLSIDKSNTLKSKFLNEDENDLPNYKDILLSIKDNYFEESATKYNSTREIVESDFNKAIDMYLRLSQILKDSKF